MKKSSNNFFHFTSTEKRATKIILVLIALLILFRLSFTFLFVYEDSVENDEQYQKELSDFFNENQKTSDSITVRYEQEENLVAFNPDTLSANGWVKLGFTSKEATSILKYKNMVGGFDTPEVIKKSYVISDKDYERLEPYMVFNQKENNYSSKDESCYAIVLLESDQPVYDKFQDYDSLLLIRSNNKYKYCEGSFQTEYEAKKLNKEGTVEQIRCNSGFWIYPNQKKKEVINSSSYTKTTIIDINIADTSDFKSLKGIGSYYAKKIINFREKLGGFYKIDQLKEVYGIDPDIIDNNIERLSIGVSSVVKLNINKLSDKELKKHPYISWQVANSIYFYRLNHGDYKTVEEITKSDVVTPEIYEKVKHYLTVAE